MNTENNKLIAEFMGLNKIGLTDGVIFKDNNTNQLHEIKYHSDWNWLMQAVEKINNLYVQGNPEIRLGKRTEVFYSPLNTDSSKKNKHFKNFPDSSINSVYQAVAEFVKWYNSAEKEN